MTQTEIIAKMRELESIKQSIVKSQNDQFENEIILDDEYIAVSQDCIDECMKLMLKDLEKQGEKLLKLYNDSTTKPSPPTTA